MYNRLCQLALVACQFSIDGSMGRFTLSYVEGGKEKGKLKEIGDESSGFLPCNLLPCT
jgi:hypothetical protein